MQYLDILLCVMHARADCLPGRSALACRLAGRVSFCLDACVVPDLPF